MLMQIVTHTPLYVWAILAFLIYRGVIAMHTREMQVSKMFIIPLVLLALSLQDVYGKFGIGGMPFVAWLVSMALSLVLVARLGKSRVAPGSADGSVLVRGSTVPLAIMMAVFFTKYCASVAVAVIPQLRTDSTFSIGLCLLFGVLNGYFIGRLLCDVLAYQSFSTQPAGRSSTAL